MTTYLLESSLSLLLAFGFYKIWLEGERMHGFKRFYLLASLLLAALLPLVEVPAAAEAAPAAPQVALPSVPVAAWEAAATFRQAAARRVAAPAPARWPALLLASYCVLTAVLLGRFTHGFARLARLAAGHPKQPFEGATLVRFAADGPPYTFLGYLFVSEAAYRRGEIAPELFSHELAHIRQRHSLDVLLIEFLLCLAWFNPLLYWVRRAMRLNHEFLADQAVNERHRDVPRYQQLLLGALAPASQPPLASAFVFRTTKQRLLMMTKHTSRTRAGLTGGSATLLLAALAALLGATSAQVAPPRNAPEQATSRPAPAPKPTQTPAPTAAETQLARQYDALVAKMPRLKGRKYASLSAAEKSRIRLVKAPPLRRRTPTAAQWAEWKNPRKFGVWVDGKRLRGHSLDDYQRTDVAAFMGSYVHKNARQPEGYLYQIDLTTTKEYERLLRNPQESYGIALRVDQRPARRR